MARYTEGVTASATRRNSSDTFSTIPPGGDRGAAGASASPRRQTHKRPASMGQSFTVTVAYRIGIGYRMFVERDGRRFMLPADSLLVELGHLTSCLGECADHSH